MENLENKVTEQTVETEKNDADKIDEMKAAGTAGEAPEGSEPQEPIEEAKFTQAQVDELIAKRLSRETKKFEKKLLEAQTSASQENPSDEEKIKKLEDDLASKDKEILNYKLAKIATELKVKPERIDAFLKLTDLGDIDVTDAEELKEALEKTSKDYPEFLITGEAPVKGEPEAKQGHIKAGVEKTEVSESDKLKEQIYTGLGLK